MLRATGVPAFLVLIAALLTLDGARLATAQVDGRPAEELLAERYRPVLYLRDAGAPCSPAREAFYPIPVEVVLDDGQNSLRDANDITIRVSAPGVAGIAGLGDSFYLDYPGDPRRPGCGYESRFGRLAAEELMYARIAIEEGHDGFALQYWFFFYFNDWNNNHEGDWEYIQLLFDAPSPEVALAAEPVSIGYSQHGGGEVAEWNDPRVRKESGHPVAYVAKGSHAMQYDPGLFLGLGEGGTGFGCDDARGRHRRIHPPVTLIGGGVVGPPSPPWLTFDGRWGQRATGEFNGPTGPQQKRAWREPFSWQESQRRSSVRVPGQQFGTNYIQGFCGAVATSAQAFFLWDRWPWAVQGVGLILGIVAVSATGVLAKDAILARRGMGRTLRRRWRLGEIIRASFALYAQNWRLFGAIAAMHFVLLAASAITARLLLHELPLGSFVRLLQDNRAWSFTATVAYGGVPSLFASIIMLCATATALDQIDRGRRPTPRVVYRAVARRAIPAMIAALLVLLAVAALSLTIVGIPLAVRLLVRWYLVEQIVVIEGRWFGHAFGRSNHLVSHATWKTLGRVLAIAAVSLGLVPLVVALLLLFTDLPLLTINIVGSVINTAGFPLAGIATTLVYFDLAERERSATPKRTPGSRPVLRRLRRRRHA